MSYPNYPASSTGGSSKMPIPRLHKQRSEAPRKAVVNRQNRVSRACLSCRSRKIKCNGLQPRCSNCSENATSCVYASSRKDRLKTATSHNQDMIALLKDLRQQVSSERQARIDDLLASVVEDVADAAASVHDPTDKYREPALEEDRGEANLNAEVGSSGETDMLDEDLMRNEETRATGFIGRASEIQWLRKLHGVDTASASETRPWTPAGGDASVNARSAGTTKNYEKLPAPLIQTSKASFYLDNEEFEIDLLVDPFEVPPFEVAETLVQAYLESAHNSFPFLAKKPFVNRFYHYYASSQQGNPYSVSRKWQATLNLVFAIGSVYCHLAMPGRRANDREHLVYHSRAWALSFMDPWWFSHPDIPHIQMMGLLSLYYLGIGHINRSWVLIGNAMRSGFALGLHLRNEDGSTGAAQKEVNSRIWWANYTLERLVSALTGRPSLVTGCACSVPLPLPLSSEDIEESTILSRFGGGEMQPLVPQQWPQVMYSSDQQSRIYHSDRLGPANSGSYLRSLVTLAEITQAALALYGANATRESWESIQKTIAHEYDGLDAWATALPEGLNFLQRSIVSGHRYRREQNTLDILYHSTKILITRPCLCRLDRRTPYQTAILNNFSQRAADMCVGAAKSIAGLLPSATPDNLIVLYQAGPWWQMVHVIMQALVILLLEIVLESMHFPDDRQDVIPSLKKLLRWLCIMRVNNNMAVRAYSISLRLVEKLSSTIKIDMTELISEDTTMDPPAEPNPAASTSTQTHTPYPNVLNPVDEPPVTHSRTPNVALAAAAAPPPPPQQQQQQEQQPQQQMYEAPPRHHHLSEPTQHNPHLTSAATVNPSYHSAEQSPAAAMSAYKDLFVAFSGFEQVVLPGWFVTSFDEHDQLSATGVESAGLGAPSATGHAKQGLY